MYNILDFTFGALKQNSSEYILPLSEANKSSNPVFATYVYASFTDRDGNILSTAGPHEYNRPNGRCWEEHVEEVLELESADPNETTYKGLSHQLKK